tara:strand:- start:275 stop:619 length:345 start_codon:yes stop_codon:yes gene_type:complete
MKLTDTLSVIKAMDRPSLDDLAFTWITESPKSWDITQEIKDHYFEITEEKFGHIQAHELAQQIDWKAVVDLLIDCEQDKIDQAEEERLDIERGWESGRYYTDRETGMVEERNVY